MIDCHVHLLTCEMIDDLSNRFEKNYPGFTQTLMDNASHIVNEKFLKYLKQTSIKDQADLWIKEMDANGIEKAVFFPISERPKQIKEFVEYYPERFMGYGYLNDPVASNASEKLKDQVLGYGVKGLKLYPCLQLFHAYDKRLYPLYETAQNLNIPITFHMGITHAPVSDYRYTNPLDLQLPVKLFPKLNFIIAHFGAGFFREVCLVGYHNKNLYLDTSGTNNWLDYTPGRMDLKTVFKRAIEIYGSNRILFGTDTVMRPDTGYRKIIMENQKEIIRSVTNNETESIAIMRDNGSRLYP